MMTPSACCRLWTPADSAACAMRCWIAIPLLGHLVVPGPLAGAVDGTGAYRPGHHHGRVSFVPAVHPLGVRRYSAPGLRVPHPQGVDPGDAACARPDTQAVDRAKAEAASRPAQEYRGGPESACCVWHAPTDDCEPCEPSWTRSIVCSTVEQTERI
jgi:hypothetical protein